MGDKGNTLEGYFILGERVVVLLLADKFQICSFRKVVEYFFDNSHCWRRWFLL